MYIHSVAESFVTLGSQMTLHGLSLPFGKMKALY